MSASPLRSCSTTKVISAPVIREPIIGGSGQISGSFTVQAANDLAILLRAGALAGAAHRDRGAHGRSGPRSGSRSKRASFAAYVGSILVIVFMLVTYRLFGVFANIAVAINVAMIFGLLSLLNATLTLPGIAGIVLHRRHRGRFQRADLRAHPRGAARRAHRDYLRSTPVSSGRCLPSSIPTSPPSSLPRCCSTSAPDRYAVLPSRSGSASSPRFSRPSR